MASKVVWYREAWWVRTRWGGNKKKDRRIGTTKTDKRQAEQIAKQINVALAVGTFEADGKRDKPLPCDAELRQWHATYAPTMKPSYETLTEGHIRNHLAPFFGARDLRDLREADLLDFARVKLADGLAPKTIRNSLSILRRVFYLHQRDGLVERNPAARIGELMRRVDRRIASSAQDVEYWSREEVNALLDVAREHEPSFAPILSLLLSTGMRRGEALGLHWSDVDFENSGLTIRRSITHGGTTSPKSGRSRTIKMPPALVSELFDLLAARRVEALGRGWPNIPEPVFCSQVGTYLDERNVSRVWERVRRRAQKSGVRPLRLHCARHTWATQALYAGKSIRWVADQLGHSDPALTLRVYAHAMREEETDLSFAEFDGSERLYPAPTPERDISETGNYANSMARREGLEPPTLRFEA
jgi:integrase